MRVCVCVCVCVCVPSLEERVNNVYNWTVAYNTVTTLTNTAYSETHY